MKRQKLGYKKYILIVDDNADLLRLVAAGLSRRGYRAVPAGSREAAISHVDIEKPGLVLLDIMMPDVDGIQLLQEIKEIDEDIPVIMLTGVWDNEEAEKCKDLGALEYVNKPVDLNDLVQIIEKVVGHP